MRYSWGVWFNRPGEVKEVVYFVRWLFLRIEINPSLDLFSRIYHHAVPETDLRQLWQLWFLSKSERLLRVDSIRLHNPILQLIRLNTPTVLQNLQRCDKIPRGTFLLVSINILALKIGLRKQPFIRAAFRWFRFQQSLFTLSYWYFSFVYD